ncbi:response regulator [soil metagenome]|nr:response regulator [Gemmatimonadota bacterium]
MRRKIVLLVEDQEDSRIIYGTILKHYGYGILEAADGDVGLQLARAHMPDLILMDVGLPHVDGCDATAFLKQDGSTSHIPIVALTAHGLHTDRERARRAGFDGYLVKPCIPTRVVAEVERLIGPSVEDAAYK